MAATTSLTLYVTIDATMDDDSATTLGVSVCQHLMEHLTNQQIPVSVITSFAHHE
jgi:hypothetical protein